MIEYTLIRSARRSVKVEVTTLGVTVRAPRLCPKREIDRIVKAREDWILRTQARLAEKSREIGAEKPLTEEELAELLRRGKEVFRSRVDFYAPAVGVTVGRITVRHQHTRWGSCSAKGNLNFNCLLLLAPPEVLDAVVVHELCHRKHMNHSKAFYAEVLRVFPDYRKWDRWLKRYGDVLMKRLPELAGESRAR